LNLNRIVSLRLRLIQARKCSTTHLRGSTWKPNSNVVATFDHINQVAARGQLERICYFSEAGSDHQNASRYGQLAIQPASLSGCVRVR
jgi:hypothetical protein